MPHSGSKDRKTIESSLAALALKAESLSTTELKEQLWALYSAAALEEVSESFAAKQAAAKSELESQLRARLETLVEEAPSAPAIPDVVAEPTEKPQETPKAQQRDLEDLIMEHEAEETPAEPAPVAEAEEAPVEEPAPIEAAAPVEEVPAPKETPEPVAEQAAPEEAPAAVSESVAERAQRTQKKASLNDRLAKQKLVVGLNDRIGFVRDLFDGSTEDFNRVVSQINTMESLDEIRDFLESHIAPEYNWGTQEETAERFFVLVEQRFE